MNRQHSHSHSRKFDLPNGGDNKVKSAAETSLDSALFQVAKKVRNEKSRRMLIAENNLEEDEDRVSTNVKSSAGTTLFGLTRKKRQPKSQADFRKSQAIPSTVSRSSEKVARKRKRPIGSEAGPSAAGEKRSKGDVGDECNEDGEKTLSFAERLKKSKLVGAFAAYAQDT